jgi:hypothetical protein
MSFRPRQQWIASSQCQATIFHLKIITIQLLSFTTVIISRALRLENSSFVYLPRFISISRPRNSYILADSRGFLQAKRRDYVYYIEVYQVAGSTGSGHEGVGPLDPGS